MLKIIDSVGTISRNARETYTTIQDDTGEGLLSGVSKLVGGYVPYSLAARLGLSGSRTPTPPQVEDVDEALGRLYSITLRRLILDLIQKRLFC